MALNPTNWANNWEAGTKNDNTKMQQGIDAVTEAPGIKAAAAADLWETNTIAAKQKFITNVQKVPLATWKEMMIKKGIPNRRTAIPLAKNKVQAYATVAAPVYQEIMANLSPRGTTPQENVQRAVEMALGLNQAALEGRLSV